MTTIHMDTEKVRNTAMLLSNWAEELSDSANSMRTISGRLSNVWQGPRVETFTGNLRAWVTQVESQAEQLQTLATRVSREADEWLLVDSNGSDSWRNISRTPASLLDSGTGGERSSGEGGAGNSFDWWVGSLAIGTGVIDIAKDLEDLKISEYGDIGRGINWLLDTPRGGWVNRIEDTGRLIKSNEFLKSNAFKYGAEVVGFGGAVAGGFLEGESWDKAVVTGTMDYLAGKAIEKTVEYLIPGAGEVMLAYDGALLAGRLAAGGMDLIGMHAEAAWLQNTLDVIDISTYTEKLNDAIFDYAGDFFSRLF